MPPPHLPALKRAALTALGRVANFSPSWFTVSMSTGAVALVVAGFPYGLPAKNAIGWAFWWLNLAMFSLFLLLLTAR